MESLIGLSTGILAHALVFHHGEWELYSLAILRFYFLSFVLANALWYLAGYDQPTIAWFGLHHLLGLYGSILVYRGFFHRLCAFPGPYVARFTNFYIASRSVKNFRKFDEIDKLHRRYGDVVRIGPSELSIACPEAVTAIYGAKSRATKGPWYDLLAPRIPLFMVRDKREHSKRRKVWDQGFSTSALGAYEPRITAAIDQLLEVLAGSLGRPTDIAKWIRFFAFDVLEDVAFSKSSNLLKNDKETEAKRIFDTIHADMYFHTMFERLPWLAPILKKTPVANANYLEFWRYIEEKTAERAKRHPDSPDILSWLLKAYESGSKTAQDRLDLHGDAHLIVVAGSDTVAATLTFAFFELASKRGLVESLQAALDAQEDLSSARLASIPLLDAVINETLRLHPAVPSGTQRLSPPEGMVIGPHSIPGNVIIQVPSHTAFRDERAFVRSKEFVPERWTTKPELIKDESVFIPFNIGKRLAMIEMRRALAEILVRYNVELAPGFDEQSFLDKKNDTFTVIPAALSLVLTAREAKSSSLPGQP